MNQKEKFIYYSSPEHWFQTALELNGSIEELFETRWRSYYVQNYHIDETSKVKRPQNSRAIYLLMSYTLENLLKGIHVLRDASLVVKGKLDAKIKTHNLNILSKTLKIRNSLAQTMFQDYISHLCIAQGRYPIGNNEQSFHKQPSIIDEDFVLYKLLYNRYSKKLSTEFSKKGWQSGFKNEELNTKPNEFRFIINPLYKP